MSELALAIAIPIALIVGLLVGWFLCERKAQHALAAANHIIAVAERQVMLAENVKSVATGVNGLEASMVKKLEGLAEVVDSMDRNQGAILSGLVNSHIIKFAGTVDGIGEQVGERSPITSARPPDLTPERVDRKRVPPVAEELGPLIET